MNEMFVGLAAVLLCYCHRLVPFLKARFCYCRAYGLGIIVLVSGCRCFCIQGLVWIFSFQVCELLVMSGLRLKGFRA